MAYWYCENCGIVGHWRAGRGSSIKYVRCNCCRGEVKMHKHQRYNLWDDQYDLLKNAKDPTVVLLLRTQSYAIRREANRIIEDKIKEALEKGAIPGVGTSPTKS